MLSASLVSLAGSVFAQRAHRRPLSAATARSRFATLVDASAALLLVEVTPADANHEIRAWDAAWEARIERLLPFGVGCDFSGASASCAEREVDALLCNATLALHLARSGLLRDDDGGDARAELADELAARRTVADEARRRSAAHLTCEDLHDHDREEFEWGWDHAQGPHGAAEALVWARDGRPVSLEATGAAPDEHADGITWRVVVWEPPSGLSTGDAPSATAGWTATEMNAGIHVRVGSGWDCSLDPPHAAGERGLRRALTCTGASVTVAAAVTCGPNDPPAAADLVLGSGADTRVLALSCMPSAASP